MIAAVTLPITALSSVVGMNVIVNDETRPGLLAVLLSIMLINVGNVADMEPTARAGGRPTAPPPGRTARTFAPRRSLRPLGFRQDLSWYGAEPRKVCQNLVNGPDPRGYLSCNAGRFPEGKCEGGLAVKLPAWKGWFYLLLWLSVAAIAGTVYIVESSSWL